MSYIPEGFFATDDLSGEYDYRIFATRQEAESYIRDCLEEDEPWPEIVEFRRASPS